MKKNYSYLCLHKNLTMLLAIDIGNTRIKAAVFEANTLLEVVVFPIEELLQKITFILQQYPKIKNTVIASVGNTITTDLSLLEKKTNLHVLSHQSKFPFQNLYTTPTTLGIDRMVLTAGAVFQYPNQNRLIIDAGTCITYDFVNENNQYLGGAITPGLRLRYEALNLFTSKLPLLQKNYPDNYIGNSTAQSIHSGVINGTIHEIDGFIEEYKTQYAKFIIILTGGDSDFLAKRLKNTIFAHSNFLLESLNQTFQYNQK